MLADGQPAYKRVLALRGKNDWQGKRRVPLASLYDKSGTAVRIVPRPEPCHSCKGEASQEEEAGRERSG